MKGSQSLILKISLSQIVSPNNREELPPAPKGHNHSYLRTAYKCNPKLTVQACQNHVVEHTNGAAQGS